MKRRRVAAVSVAALTAGVLAVATPGADAAAPPSVVVATVTSTGAALSSILWYGEGEGAITPDGRFLVFTSGDPTVVAGDTNGTSDVFVRDLTAGTSERVSVATGGAQGNGDSNGADISDDGRYVVYRSTSTNLVAGDTNAATDIFLRDRTTGTTTRVSTTSGGAQLAAGSDLAGISGDGSVLLFRSSGSGLPSSNGLSQVYVKERAAGTVSLVSRSTAGTAASANSYNSAISADGRYVAFLSLASNLVTGDTNGRLDAFLTDRIAGTTERVSLTESGAESSLGAGLDPVAVSDDGSVVVFGSSATDLVAGDANGAFDVFVRDRTAATTALVSATSAGTSGNGTSNQPSVSGDGRLIAFTSTASNLVAGDTNNNTDVFVRDRALGETSRASVSSTGAQLSVGSYTPLLSRSGAFLALYSGATNILPGGNVQGVMRYGVTAPTPTTRTLTVTVTGNGTVTSSPTGISCPPDCSEALSVGTQVTLTATPSFGSKFDGFTGACAGPGVCAIDLSANASASAAFSAVPTGTLGPIAWQQGVDTVRGGPGLSPTVVIVGGFNPGWSPDASRLAVSRADGEVWTYAADGTDPRRVTSTVVSEGDPVYSPDGSHLLFRRSTSPATLVLALVDGTNERTLATSGNVFEYAFSPSGASLVYSTAQTLRRYDLVTDTSSVLVPASGAYQYRRPQWSQDGQWILFDSVDTAVGASSNRLERVRPDGTGREVLPLGQAVDGDLSPDGTQVVYRVTNTSPLTVAPVAGGTPTPISLAGGGFPDWGTVGGPAPTTVTIVASDPAISALVAGLAAAIPELDAVTTGSTTLTIQGCPSTVPKPASSDDYLLLMDGQAYTAVGGAAAPAAAPECRPGAVTAYGPPG